MKKINTNNAIKSIVNKTNNASHETFTFIFIFVPNNVKVKNHIEGDNGKKAINEYSKKGLMHILKPIHNRLDRIYHEKKKIYYRDTMLRDLELNKMFDNIKREQNLEKYMTGDRKKKFKNYKYNNKTTIKDNDPAFKVAFIAVATVLRSLFHWSYNKTIEAMRYELQIYGHKVNNIIGYSDIDHDCTINSKGKSETKYNENNIELHNLIEYTSDTTAYDLVHDAYLFILEYLEKYGYFYRPIKKQVLNSKRKIKECDVFKTVETTGLDDLHNFIRSKIRTENTTKEMYKEIYLDEIVENSDGDEIRYYEICQYKELAYVDNYGNTQISKCDIEFADKFMIDMTNELTEKQMTILQALLKYGAGKKAIATATGISLNTVKSAVREIRKKTIKWFNDNGIDLASIKLEKFMDMEKVSNM